jgi:hypothetical protein
VDYTPTDYAVFTTLWVWVTPNVYGNWCDIWLSVGNLRLCGFSQLYKFIIHKLEKVCVLRPSLAQIGAYILGHIRLHCCAAVSAVNTMITAEHNMHTLCQGCLYWLLLMMMLLYHIHTTVVVTQRRREMLQKSVYFHKLQLCVLSHICCIPARL